MAFSGQNPEDAMPVINRIAAYQPDMIRWRHHIHMNPELELDTPETAAFVVERLREFGVDEIHTGIAQNGVVAIINGRGVGPTIGLRADMDALPILEAKGHEYASQVAGRMHACGHDGHTTMLLGAARYLAETRNFSGRVALVFQPAEEEGNGAEVMMNEGVIERFDITRIFAIHNAPNRPEGHFFLNSGPLMAAVDSFRIEIEGKGSHAAYPDQGIDPVMVAVEMAQTIQTIRSRNVAGLDNLVVSLTQIHAGETDNVVPQTAILGGTVRSLSPETRDLVEKRMQAIVTGIAAAHGARAVLHYERQVPVTVNDAESAAFAAEVAAEIAGPEAVDANIPPEMGAEDFAFMLEAIPGAYVFLGQGPGANVHHPEYDFNDAIIPTGASYFVRLVERANPLRPAE